MTTDPARASPPAAAGLGPEEAAKALSRLVDRLRSLGLPRLERRVEAVGASPAELAHAVCVRWATLTHGTQGPQVPVLSASAAGDQLAVIGREVLDAWRQGRLAADACEQVAADLALLRSAT